MAGRITPGPSANGLNDNFAASFVTASDGKPALAVVNTDGTTVSGGGGGGGTVAISQTTPGSTNNVSISGSSGAGTSVLIKDSTAFGDGVTSGILAVHPELYRTGTADYARWPGDATSGAFVQLKGGTNGLALESGGNLATITTDVAPLVVSNAGGYVRQDSTATIAKESGGNLATIVTNTGLGSTAANQTNGNQQTKITNGTNVADVLASDTGFNGAVIANATKTISFTTSIAGAQTLLANTDVRGYGTVEVVYTSVGTGLANTGQFSATSGGTYVSSSNFASGTAGFSGALGTTVSVIYTSPIKGNFFQIAISALTSGTVSGTVTLRANPPQSSGVAASQTGTWTVGSNSATGSAIPANAFFIGLQNGSGNLTGWTVSSAQGDGGASGSTAATSQVVYNGSTYDRIRTPVIVKTATATASGDTAVWTPTSGKKFRLMRFMITLTANVSLAAGAVEEVIFRDSTTAMPVGFSEFVPTTAVTTNQGGFTSGWVDIGNGILSATANNVLNINLGTALATGECRILVCGTEE